MPAPFVLLDDARADGASPARLYRDPREIVVARRPGEVVGALERIDSLRREGAHLAGYLAYEAGLALEAEYYWRTLSDVQGTGVAAFADIDDHGYQVQASAMPLPQLLQVYGFG